MPLTISPVLSSDLEDTHRFQLSVAAQEPVSRLAFPNGASDVSVAGYVERSRKCISNPTSPLRRVIAREDGDPGGVVGYALWSFVRDSQAVIETTDAGGVVGTWPGDVKKEVLEAWIGLKKRKREKVMQGKPHACMFSFFFFFLFTESVGFSRFYKVHTYTARARTFPQNSFINFASLEYK